jgi:hypothetical protein
VDVDAEHGHILSDPQVIEELQNRAHALGSSRN